MKLKCLLLIWIPLFLQTVTLTLVEAADKKLKVGVVLSLTGDAAMSGEAIRKGIELARTELEAEGWNIELALHDGETKPSKVLSSFQYLLGQGHTLFIGPTWGFEISSVKQLLERKEVVTFAPAGSSDINGGPSRSVFNLSTVRTGETDVLARWFKTNSFKRAAILVPRDDWGLVHAKVFEDALRSSGIELLGKDDFDYGLNPSALKSLLLKHKAKNADVLLTTGSAGDLANMLKVRKELQWNAAFVSTEDLWDAIDLKLLSPTQNELHNSWVIGPPLVGDFFKKFKNHYNETPKVHADRGYDALMLLANAVKSVGTEPSAVRKFLLNQNEYQGVSGAIKFNADGDRISGEYRLMEALNNDSRS